MVLKAVYVHVPFCSARCGYCAFYSSTDLSLADGWLAALERDIAAKRVRWPDFFDGGDATLYIGGGNPAILPSSHRTRMFDLVAALPFRFVETSCEANPGSIDLTLLDELAARGVTRLSVGVQSFDDDVLATLGRNHRAADAVAALDLVASRWDNFSIDLIAGVPGVKRDWEAEFRQLDRFAPPHLSCYLLSIEDGTPLAGRMRTDDEAQAAEYDNVCRLAAIRGYRHYEVSSFARPGFQCRHNGVYWARGEYAGFGPSAVSFFRHTGGEQRVTSPAPIGRYLADPSSVDVENLSGVDGFVEALALGLRTDAGVDLSSLGHDFPERSEGISSNIDALVTAGLLRRDCSRLVIPEPHWLVANEIVLRLTGC